jgi:hypothetical protein
MTRTWNLKIHANSLHWHKKHSLAKFDTMWARGQNYKWLRNLLFDILAWMSLLGLLLSGPPLRKLLFDILAWMSLPGLLLSGPPLRKLFVAMLAWTSLQGLLLNGAPLRKLIFNIVLVLTSPLGLLLSGLHWEGLRQRADKLREYGPVVVIPRFVALVTVNKYPWNQDFSKQSAWNQDSKDIRTWASTARHLNCDCTCASQPDGP